MAENNVAKLIAAFVLLVVGLSLVTVIAGEVNNKNDLTDYSTTVSILRMNGANNVNESYRYNATVYMVPNNANRDWKATNPDCTISSVTLQNSSSTLAPTTDYVWTSDGAGTNGYFTLVNTTGVVTMGSNTTTLSWQTCSDEYTTSTFGRTAMDVTVGLFAVALLLAAVGLFYSVAKDTFM